MIRDACRKFDVYYSNLVIHPAELALRKQVRTFEDFKGLKLRSAGSSQLFLSACGAAASYLPGPEITNDVVCDLDGKVLSVVSRQRIRVRGGEVTVGKTVFDPAIAHACVRIAEMLPAVGPITVQCMMKRTPDGEAPAFTEINARLGGGVPLGISAGADSPLERTVTG